MARPAGELAAHIRAHRYIDFGNRGATESG